ncbi:MAG: HEAT repeat domain-containing protein, partial [Anaerolineaceae bacterium]
MSSNLFQLHQFIVKYYTLEELKELCFHLGVEYEDLGEERISSKARELILLLGSERRLDALLARLREERPDPFNEAKFSTTPKGITLLYDELLIYEETSRFSQLSPIDKKILQDKESAYLQTVASEWAEVRTQSGATVPLGNVYVMLQALLSERPNPASNRPDIAPLQSRHEHLGAQFEDELEQEAPPPPPPIPLADALKQQQHLVILGEPGSGKSTSLQYIALYFANQGEPGRVSLDLSEQRLPLFVSIRTHVETLKQNGVEEALAAELKLLSDFSETEALDSIRRWRRDGSLVVLWDGLDEVQREDRVQVARALRLFNQKKGGDKCRVIVTSRLAGYQHDLGSPFQEYLLKPFESAADVIPYVASWLDALQSDAILETAEQLVLNMTKQRGLKNVLDNPLFLQLAVETYVKTGEIVDSRFGLYRIYTEKVAKQNARRRGADPTLLKLSIEALQLIAWAMHSESQNSLSGLKRILEHEGFQQARALLDMLREQMGLLVYDNTALDPHVYFAHLTFQEFFVARRLRAFWLDGHDNVAWAFLRPRVHDPSWREPIFLLASSLERDATLLVERIFTARSSNERELHRDLYLAAELINSGIKVEAEVINKTLLRARWIWSENRERLHKVIRLGIFLLGAILPFVMLPWWGALLLLGMWAVVWATDAFLPIKSLLLLPSRLFGLGNSTEDIVGLYAVHEIEEATQPSPMEALAHPDSTVRESAVEALAEMGDLAAVPGLIKALGDSDWEVQTSAAEALGEIGDIVAVPSLIEALADPESDVRGDAAEAQGKIGDAAAVPSLIEALGDPETNVRYDAAVALGEIGDAAAVPSLVNALDDKSKYVRSSASE